MPRCRQPREFKSVSAVSQVDAAVCHAGDQSGRLAGKHHPQTRRSLARSQKQTDYLVLAGQCALTEQGVNMNPSLTFVLMKNCFSFSWYLNKL